MNTTLERFHAAQDGAPSGFDAALRELRAGRKTSHWIWYVFPQLAGLGHSPTAEFYAIRTFDEACDYLRDEALRKRLIISAEAVREQLGNGIPLEVLMGGETDALKLVSSLTLFEKAARRVAAETREAGRLACLCEAVLAGADRQGFARCAHTLAACPSDGGESSPL